MLSRISEKFNLLMFIYKDITDRGNLSGFCLHGDVFKGAGPFIALSLASELLSKPVTSRCRVGSCSR